MNLIGCIPVFVLHEMFEADFETGLLKWKARPVSHFKNEISRNKWNCRTAGKPAGGPHKEGYSSVYVEWQGKRHGLLVHRVLWAMKHGEWPRNTIDHINMDRTDNRICNIREATYTENNVNRPSRRNGLKGVVFCKQTGRYRAQVSYKNKSIWLGRFKTEIEAHEAYMNKCKELYGEFARG